MRINSEEAIRRGREARDKAGSWMELRKIVPIGRFSDRDMVRDARLRHPPRPEQDDQ